MAGNSFQGSIPSSFSQLKGLQSLDLSRNNLSGLIPEFLGNFRFLSYLNLSFNNFEGELPKHGVFTNLTAFSVLGNSKLCGGVQALNLPPCPTPSSSKRHLSRKLVAAISVASGIICLILLLCLFGIHRWMPKSKKEGHAADGIKVPHMMVTYAELLRATDGFSSANLVGVGSFGSVYKGFLNYEEYQLVAVKVLNLQQSGASRSFVAECEALRNVRHRNLVKILTACTSTDYRGNDFKALLYEFMPNGSLEKWVHPEANEQGQTRALSLIRRLNILIDVASALDYLHHNGPEPIVHCDIKPSNVLLDHDMVAHVGDFGLARFLNRSPVEASQRSSTSMIFKGSIGYVAPEYGVANKVSVEGDVYSYGILLLETLTGKRPTGETLKDDLSLPRYLEMALPERVAEIIDPNLLLEEGEETNECTRDRAMECLALSLEIGIRCTKESPLERMQLVDAINELTAIRNAYLEHTKQGRRTQLRDEDPVLD
ncbi:LRR receptor-like serine threonine-protein kinase [Musa troglodytarum]|uniref:Receptor kinase-like protein Xa21 n=1 Tax=Musa troglodytarum TaxID=320322 RepID=A0A9E7GHW8_9LILI|nr:LRR receptor-like serine threonine-protein kinase [Musa troglodytarum]